MKINPASNYVKFLNFLSKNNLINKNDSCLIAVSGGYDSVALLDLLYKLRILLKINLGIAHVNYNLRGQASLDEEEYVMSLAKIYKLPFYCHSIDLKNKN